MFSADGRTGFSDELADVFGLTGLCGLESLECFEMCDVGATATAAADPPAFGFDVVVCRRRLTGVFSTDLKYFSCIESSLLPSKLPLRCIWYWRAAEPVRPDDDMKLPDRISDMAAGLPE
jgi:hypothetical protein